MPLFVQEKLSIPSRALRDKYLVPPFSMLHSQVGEWLKNRNEWEGVIKNRSDNIRNITTKHNTPYINKFDYDIGYKGLERNGASSTFDPFLCEILVKWFSRPNDKVLDPFAGGHVRGAVSGILGRDYVGVDISEPQVLNNRDCWKSICDRYNSKEFGNVEWILGDSLNVPISGKYDMLLACPPYYNLEVYTDVDGDISRLNTYTEFLDSYKKIFKKFYDLLDEDTFAAIVVEEVRDKDGIFYGFVPDTINVMKECGFKYYNEMILENRIMSLGVRCPKYFEQSRKIGRHHQNVLIFFKGNPKNIESKFGRFTLD